jgi:hypothetical protein
VETSDTLGRTGLVLDSMPNAETNCRSNGSLEAKDEILRTSLPAMFALIHPRLGTLCTIALYNGAPMRRGAAAI